MGCMAIFFLKVLNATTQLYILGCIWTKEMVELSMYYCDKISEGFTRNLTSSGNTLSVMCLFYSQYESNDCLYLI